MEKAPPFGVLFHWCGQQNSIKSRSGFRRAGNRQQSTGLARVLSRMVFPRCTVPKPPLCKGRWAAERRLGGVVNPSVKNQRFMPAPFTQGSLSQLSNIAQHHRQKPVVSKCALKRQSIRIQGFPILCRPRCGTRQGYHWQSVSTARILPGLPLPQIALP